MIPSSHIVQQLIAGAFGDRPLTSETARRGLVLAAHELLMIELREVAGKITEKTSPR